MRSCQQDPEDTRSHRQDSLLPKSSVGLHPDQRQQGWPGRDLGMVPIYIRAEGEGVYGQLSTRCLLGHERRKIPRRISKAS